MALKLKSSTTSNRVRRSPEFKATVLALMASGTKAKDALVEACDQFDYPCPDSYEKYPHTFISQFRTSIAKILENEEHPNFDNVVDVLRDADLIDEEADNNIG